MEKWMKTGKIDTKSTSSKQDTPARIFTAISDFSTKQSEVLTKYV